MELEMSEIVVI